MVKNKTLLIIIAVLLVSNLVLLYFITRPEPVTPAPTRTERMVKMLQEELDLDTTQTAQYLSLRAYRDSLLAAPQADLRQAKLNLINLLSQDSLSDATIDSATAVVGQRQQMVEAVYFRHFMRLQKVLSAQQKPKLDSLLTRMIIRGAGGQENRRSNNN